MKKRLICTVCFLLAVFYAVAGSAATTLTLPEKLDKQISVGNGLKGSILLQGEGNDPLILSLEPILNVPMELRGMKPENDWHYYLYQAGENESQTGLTELYCQDGQYYFRSDLLPGHVLSLPSADEIVDEITAPQGGNPSFVSVLMKVLTMSDEQKTTMWKPFIDKMTQKIEVWLTNYIVSSSLVTDEKGDTVVEQNYTVPMAELKKEILTLTDDIRGDADMISLVESLLSKKQRKTYFNENLNYYYLEAMDALEDEFDVTLIRKMTVMGDEISSFIELPLDQSRYGYSALEITDMEGEITFRLNSDTRSLIVITGDDWMNDETFKGMTCRIMSIPGPEADEDEPGSAVRLEIRKTTETFADEETGDHQRDQWTLKIEDDMSRLPENSKDVKMKKTTPITAELTLHYYSKYSQSSPTKLDITALFEKEDLKLSLEGKFRTASPWIFSPFDISSAENLLKLSDEVKVVYLAEWLASAGEQFRKQQDITSEIQTETEPSVQTTETAETPEAPETETQVTNETQASEEGEPV